MAVLVSLSQCIRNSSSVYSIPPNFTEIGHRALAFSRGVKRFILPTSITRIWDNAFIDCSDLEEIEIPESITEIGKQAFANCKSLERIKLSPTVRIETDTFAGCNRLKVIEFSGSHEILTIHLEVFKNCFKDCDPNIEIIASGTIEFYDPTQETKRTQPKEKKNKKKIDNKNDVDRDDILKFWKRITIENGIAKIRKRYKVIGVGCFAHCKIVKIIQIPETIMEIQKGAFRFCPSLEHVVIPNTVNQIPCSAFKGCCSLKRLQLPNSIQVIDRSAFEECSHLSIIEIPASVKQIKKHAFFNCKKLKIVNFFNSQIDIDNDAFRGHSSDLTFFAPEGSPAWQYAKQLQITVFDTSTLAFFDQLIDTDQKNPCIPSRFKVIGPKVFKNRRIQSISIPDTIVKIGLSAFQKCIYLSHIDIPDSVKVIGPRAFKYSGLRSVRLSSAISKIDIESFACCRELLEIVVPDSVSEIGYQAFAYCDHLRCVEIPKSVHCISPHLFDDHHIPTIITPKDSYAWRYAIEHGIPCEELR